MAKYNGSKCISCGEVFETGDDIVVCPECGTPYHRDCYHKEGTCINTELHDKNESWKPVPPRKEQVLDGNEQNEQSDEPIKCGRCGETNEPDKLFCVKCGMPLNRNESQERPFNNYTNQNMNNGGFNQQNPQNFNQQGFMPNGSPFGMGVQMTYDKESDVDGIKLGDYAKYIGKNPIIMLTNFIKFAKLGVRHSFNFGALLFPEFYFFYRKMPLRGIIFLLITILLSVPQLIYIGQNGMISAFTLSTHIDVEGNLFNVIYNLASAAMLGVKIAATLYANYWYYKKAKRDITKIRDTFGADETVIDEQIKAKGGTSIAMLILSVLVSMALSTLVIFILNSIPA